MKVFVSACYSGHSSKGYLVRPAERTLFGPVGTSTIALNIHTGLLIGPLASRTSTHSVPSPSNTYLSTTFRHGGGGACTVPTATKFGISDSSYMERGRLYRSSGSSCTHPGCDGSYSE